MFRVRKVLLSVAASFLLALAVLSPMPGAVVSASNTSPMLNISSIECSASGAVVHFVLVHNTFTLSQLQSATVEFQYTYQGKTYTATAPFQKLTGKTAQFLVTLSGQNSGTLTVTGGTLSIAGQTIDLHNTLSANLTCGQPPAPTTGTLKVCKVLASGTTVPAGTLFTFSVGTSTVSVAPGTCATVNDLTAGQVTVTETGPSGYTVSAIAFLAGTGTTNVAGGSAVATITAGQTTEVQFTNEQQAQTGILKVCKVLAAGTTAPAGTLFTFTVGTQTVSVAPGTCAELTAVPVGSVTVTETGPSGYTVSAITFLAGTGTTNVAAGSAVATITANATTEVQFTNMAATGYIEICKATTGGLTGTFNFTSPAFAGTQSITVVSGASQPVCTSPIQVPAGNVSITEATGTGFALTNVSISGGGSLGGVSGTTATVSVPAGSVANQTVVTFTNAPNTAYIEICKSTTGGLTGTFSFTSPAFSGTQSITVVTGASQPVCTNPIQVTAGQISITEAAGANFQLSGVTVGGSGSLASLTGMTAVVNVPAGDISHQTIVYFTNAPCTQSSPT